MFSDGMYMIRLPVFTAPTVPRWYFIQSALRTTFSHRLTLCTFLFSLPFFLLSRSLVVEGTGAVDNDLFKACQKALATLSGVLHTPRPSHGHAWQTSFLLHMTWKMKKVTDCCKRNVHTTPNVPSFSTDACNNTSPNTAHY